MFKVITRRKRINATFGVTRPHGHLQVSVEAITDMQYLCNKGS